MKNAKIACLDFSLQKAKMKMGVQVLVTDPEELEKIRDRESDITKERIKKILGKWLNSDFLTQSKDLAWPDVLTNLPKNDAQWLPEYLVEFYAWTTIRNFFDLNGLRQKRC